MHIGLDFDNTIVCYDKVFTLAAREKFCIPQDIPFNKTAVKKFFQSNKQEELWTELQGYVYGAKMEQAEIYPGLMSFLDKSKKANWKITVVSHKTKYPYIGEKYDLHQAATFWIERFLGKEKNEIALLFEPTLEAKVKRIATLGCNIYVDDLLEVLLSPFFPKDVQKVLFDPNKQSKERSDIMLLHDWHSFYEILEANFV